MTTGLLLLEDGISYLLLEDGISRIKLEPVINTVTLSESNVSIGSDVVSRQLIATRNLVEVFTGLLLLENGSFLLLENGIDRLILEYPNTTPGIVIIDSLSRKYVGTRTLSEINITITANVNRILIASRSLIESLISIGSDTLSRTAIFTRTLAQTHLSITDFLQRKGIYSRTITESNVGIIDTVSRKGIFSRALSESGITIGTDSLTRQLIAIRNLIESNVIIPLDMLTRNIIASRSISEINTIITDALIINKRFQRFVTESAISITDSLSYVLLRIRGIRITVDFKNPKQLINIDFSNPKQSNSVDFKVDV